MSSSSVFLVVGCDFYAGRFLNFDFGLVCCGLGLAFFLGAFAVVEVPKFYPVLQPQSVSSRELDRSNLTWSPRVLREIPVKLETMSTLLPAIT
ncbi:unnamed protein product [Phytophthora fragariaefolia]|uniref:Unnamed protein product n=1 Tax=Phytophthora fragariaefolia TaxID=1490495 RepID=A0A9W6Y331_9STRA|nr:unnamed protein product [Phytophthora fragariaefolia]